MRPPSYLKGALLLIFIIFISALIFISGKIGMWLGIGLLVFGGLTLLFSLVAQLQNAFLRPARRLYAKDFALKLLATLMYLKLSNQAVVHLYSLMIMNNFIF